MSEVCERHGCELETFVSATEEGTEYFTYCQKCEDEYDEWVESQLLKGERI